MTANESRPAGNRAATENHNNRLQSTAPAPMDAAAEQHADRVRREARSLFQGQAAARNALAHLDIEQLLHRFIADALNEATGRYWRARAEVFESARPHPGDFTGRADPAELARLDAENAAVAQACRNHADAIGRGWLDHDAA